MSAAVDDGAGEAITHRSEAGDLPHTRTARTDKFLRPIQIDGRRAGTWRRVMGRKVVIETNLFARLHGSQVTKLEAAARRYGAFLGKPVSLA